jgi:hypothetical protein
MAKRKHVTRALKVAVLFASLFLAGTIGLAYCMAPVTEEIPAEGAP